ncbi:MAG: SpoIIE family protein phosphatase [Clostridiales bacterium]|nr:SpoIIE family protein phosphatase [Clostridiales bacterium]
MKSISVKVRKTLMTSLIIVIALFTVIAVSFIYIQKKVYVDLNDESSTELEKFTDDVIYENIRQYSRDITAACGSIIENNYERNSSKGDSVADYIISIYGNAPDESQSLNTNGIGFIGGVTEEKTEEFYKIGSVRDYIKTVPGYDCNNLDTLDIFVVTESGIVLDGTDGYLGDDYGDLRDDDWYVLGKEAMEPVWTDVIVGSVTGQEKIDYVVPLIYEDEFKGVVVVSAPLIEIYNTLLNINFEGVKDVVLTDSKGERIIGGDDYDIFAIQNSREVIFNGDYCLTKYNVKAADSSVYFIFDVSEVLSAIEDIQGEIGNMSLKMSSFSMQFIMMAVILFICIAVVAALIAAWYSKRTAGHIVNPILELCHQVEAFGKGDMDIEISKDVLETGDEVGLLAEKFVGMSHDLKDYLGKITKYTAEQERFKTEMEAAANIQLSLMSQDFPKSKEYSVFAFMKAAKSVGGDLYAVFKVDDDNLLVSVADVAGKGIPASLFSVRTKVYIQVYGEMGLKPSEILERVNDSLCQNNDENVFVTVFLGILNIRTGRFSYANAGHNKPVVIGENTHWLKSVNSLPLGCMEGIKYKDEYIMLNENDSVYMYSDGVTEAIGEDNSFYGDDRLIEKLSHVNKDMGSEDIISLILDDLKAHHNGVEQSDDITMLLVKYTNK